MSARDGHLGDLAAALVDGALDGDTRDLALAHVAGCTGCRAEVDEQRRCKDGLRQLEAPALPAGLAARLMAVPEAAELGAPRRPRAPISRTPARPVPALAGVSRRPGGGAGPTASRPGRVRPPSKARPDRRRSRGARVAGGVTALALGFVVVVTLGPGRNAAPSVSPPVGQFTVEHAQTTGGFPGAAPAAGAVMTVSANR